MRKDQQVLEHWIDKHLFKLTDHYRMLARRYCSMYCNYSGYPIGRAIAKFMLYYNKRQSLPEFQFGKEEINWYYYY